VKHRWWNLAKVVDFSKINVDEILLTASNEGWDSAAVTMVVKDLKADIKVRGENGMTPLMLACRRGAPDTVQCLIDLRSDIESKDDAWYTALMQAARNGSEGCVRILLFEGAQVAKTNVDGKSAIDYAKEEFKRHESKNLECIIRMLEGETVYLLQGAKKRESNIRKLKNAANEGYLADFFDVWEVPHSYISEVLATPSGVASLDNLMQLLWFGANVEHIATSLAPLSFAGIYGTPLIISVLLQAGANLKYRDSSGASAFSLAAQFGTLATVRKLLEAKSDINVKELNGWSSLHGAAKTGNLGVVNLLLELKADVNAENFQKYTPLHVAAWYGTHKMVQTLLEAKASVNAITDDGFTPLLIAVRYRKAVIAVELMKMGASVHDTYQGCTVYEMAMQNQCDKENLLKLLGSTDK